jgi:predicted alpha/beta hydrolase
VEPPQARNGEAASIEHVTAADGVRLALHRLGRPGAAPILLVAGAFSDHRFWLGTRGAGFAREAAAAGFEAFVLDHRGHGESERPQPAEKWSFRDWIVSDVPAALERAGRSGRAVVVGHSAGGAAVLSALAARPELCSHVAGVIAAATPAPVLSAFRRSGAWTAERLSQLFGRFPARALGLGGEDELSEVMAQWMRWNRRGRWGWNGGPNLTAALRDLSPPVLVVAGSGDRVFAPPELCRALAASIGGGAEFREFGKRTGASRDFGHAGLVVDRAARTEVWPVLLAWALAIQSGKTA